MGDVLLPTALGSSFVAAYAWKEGAGNQSRREKKEKKNQGVVALEGGLQSGGVVHSPNPRGWLLGEVQVISQIYSRSQNTRTLEDLE